MSKFREQLEHAKDAYASVKYPGDLVADLRRRNRGIPWRVLAPIAAVAAVVAVVITLMPEPPSTNGPEIVSRGGEVDETVAELLVPEAVPLPADVVTSIPAKTFAIPATVSVPEMPSIPTWSVSTDVSLDDLEQG